MVATKEGVMEKKMIWSQSRFLNDGGNKTRDTCSAHGCLWNVSPWSTGDVHYFVTLHIHYMWLYTLKCKNEVNAVVEQFMGQKMKVLRSDNDGEYMSTEFSCHELTVPKNPQRNRVKYR